LLRRVFDIQVRFALQNRIAQPIRDGILLCGFRVQESSNVTNAELAIPVSLYSGKDPYLEELRAKIKEAEKLKLKSRHLDTQANILLEKTQEDLVEKNLVTGEQPKLFDRWFVW
jgi:hypothetical protein